MKKAALNGLLFLCLLLSFLSTGGGFWMEQRRQKINKNRSFLYNSNIGNSEKEG